jgi:hypothetical protein
MVGRTYSLFFLILLAQTGMTQPIEKYDLWQLEEGELFWSFTYTLTGKADSILQITERMIRASPFAYSIVRSGKGFYGELRNYTVDCKRYSRNQTNTPSIYWNGTWTGKFTIDVDENQYRVIVYALHYEKPEPTEWYHKKARTTKGSYVKWVTNRKNQLKKQEFSNLALMSMSLKDSFDLRQSVSTNKK